jgi:hypothetical protein
LPSINNREKFTIAICGVKGLSIVAREKSTRKATAHLVGVSATGAVGRIAAKGVSCTGEKRRGKYDHEALRGYEFSVKGHLMRKERIFDRKNNRYRELVVNSDTGEVVRDVEQPLSEHRGHGSAKHKKQTCSGEIRT